MRHAGNLPDSTQALPNSIAVLPFINISDDANNVYFSEGLSEELLNLLVKIPELKVAARNGTSRGSRQLSLQDLGALGELIGGIAVIATLTYLAFQVRQGTKTIRANSVQELTENILGASATLLKAENAEVYLRGARSYSSLTFEEKFRFTLILGLFVGRLDTVLEYRERGMVNDEYVAFHSDTIRLIFSNAGVREWWELGQKTATMTRRVRVWVDENVAA